MTNHFTHSLFFGYPSGRLHWSCLRIKHLYFSLLVCVHQLDQQNLKFSLSLLHSGAYLQATLAKPTLLPTQAISVLEEFITRAKAGLTSLVLQPWVIQVRRECTPHQPRWKGEERRERGRALFGQRLNGFTSKQPSQLAAHRWECTWATVLLWPKVPPQQYYLA